MSKVKKIVGYEAAKYVEDGMIVGLGTGSTAYYFIQAVGERFQNGELANIQTVVTSSRSAKQAEEYGMPVRELDDVNGIDLLVDGADEATVSFDGIKGGGGAHLYEKIVASASNKIIWIVGDDKIVDHLGAFPLAVEVVKFGSFTLFKKFEDRGWNPEFRKVDSDSLYMTDDDNYIIDLHLGKIDDPEKLAHELNNTVGVIEHGLFLDHPDKIISANEAGEITVYER